MARLSCLSLLRENKFNKNNVISKVVKNMLDKQAFRDYGEGTQDKSIVIPVKLNLEEIEQLKDGMLRIRQTKKGTALKQLFKMGYAKVLSEEKITETVMENHRKNKRLGVADLKEEIENSFKKVGKL